MRRYYISPIVGDGSESNPFRPKVANYGVPWVGVQSTGPDGRPDRTWSLVLVNTTDHTALIADPDIRAIPMAALDNTLSTLTTQQRQFLRDVVQELGLDTSQVTAQTTLRQVLRQIGRALVGSFDENRFDVK